MMMLPERFLLATGRVSVARAAGFALVLGSLAGALLSIVPLAAQDAKGQETKSTVTIDNFTFGPPDITVSVGTTVTWTNHDDIPHSVVENDKTFRSRALDTDESYSFTFTSPGTFQYFCGLHPHMVGKVIVKS